MDGDRHLLASAGALSVWMAPDPWAGVIPAGPDAGTGLFTSRDRVIPNASGTQGVPS